MIDLKLNAPRVEGTDSQTNQDTNCRIWTTRNAIHFRGSDVRGLVRFDSIEHAWVNRDLLMIFLYSGRPVSFKLVNNDFRRTANRIMDLIFDARK